MPLPSGADVKVLARFPTLRQGVVLIMGGVGVSLLTLVLSAGIYAMTEGASENPGPGPVWITILMYSGYALIGLGILWLVGAVLLGTGRKMAYDAERRGELRSAVDHNDDRASESTRQHDPDWR